MFTRLSSLGTRIMRFLFGPCWGREHNFGRWNHSGHIHYRKGEREVYCFAGSIRYCLRPYCGEDEFAGLREALPCEMLDQENLAN